LHHLIFCEVLFTHVSSLLSQPHLIMSHGVFDIHWNVIYFPVLGFPLLDVMVLVEHFGYMTDWKLPYMKLKLFQHCDFSFRMWLFWTKLSDTTVGNTYMQTTFCCQVVWECGGACTPLKTSCLITEVLYLYLIKTNNYFHYFFSLGWETIKFLTMETHYQFTWCMVGTGTEEVVIYFTDQPQTIVLLVMLL
jgi:hypothetical protein